MSKRKFFPKLSEYVPFKDPLHVIFPTAPKCPKCGDFLELRSVKPHWFPYIHVDVALECVVCMEYYTFGIPMNRHAGLSLIIWDSNPQEALKHFMRLGKRYCPYKHGEMLPTKIFGDWIPDTEQVEYQWKCPVCFLTKHESYKRTFPHLKRSPFTKEEEKEIRKKLEELGYLG